MHEKTVEVTVKKSSTERHEGSTADLIASAFLPALFDREQQNNEHDDQNSICCHDTFLTRALHAISSPLDRGSPKGSDKTIRRAAGMPRFREETR